MINERIFFAGGLDQAALSTLHDEMSTNNQTEKTRVAAGFTFILAKLACDRQVRKFTVPVWVGIS